MEGYRPLRTLAVVSSLSTLLSFREELLAARTEWVVHVVAHVSWDVVIDLRDGVGAYNTELLWCWIPAIGVVAIRVVHVAETIFFCSESSFRIDAQFLDSRLVAERLAARTEECVFDRRWGSIEDAIDVEDAVYARVQVRRI